MSNFSANLRFLLWRNGVPRQEWAEGVMQWINGRSTTIDSQHDDYLAPAQLREIERQESSSQNVQDQRRVTYDRRRAHELLTTGNPSEQEVHQIAQTLGLEAQELFYTDLLAQSDINIWQENVAHLVNSLKRGEQSKLVSYLGLRSPGTVTKWKSKQANPEKKHKQGLQNFFGLPLSVDLEQTPLFLSLSPVDVVSQRAWLHEHIDQLGDLTLQNLFPALERLLRDP